MRRPPSNLDDFLTGGEATSAVVDPKDSTTSTAPNQTQPAKKPTQNARKTTAGGRKKTPTPAPVEVASAEIENTEPPVVEVSAAEGSAAEVPAAEVESVVAPPARSAAHNPEESMNRAPERQRSRTVPGEAAPTVIMSVRVPIELRERLEDILAAYSGVTFSDLVIRGLESVVQEVEDNHRNRTGQELPKRVDRPEFPL